MQIADNPCLRSSKFEKCVLRRPMRLPPSKILRWFAQLGLAALLLTLPVKSQPMSDTSSDAQAIRSVIEQQLQAFQRDDAKTAFSFASDEIRQKFGTAENFLKMVQVAYPAVYRPRSIMFERLGYVDGTQVQEVILLAPDGNLIKALYMMQRQPDGGWKIGGCVLVPVKNVGETI